MPTQPRVALVQDGSRGHYGLAVALHQAGLLDTMYADFFIRPGSFWSAVTPLLRLSKRPAVRRMLDRRCAALNDANIKTNFSMRRRQDRERRNFENDFQFFRWQAADTGKWITQNLSPSANVLMAFIRNVDSGLCARARERGLRTIGEQIIAPAFIERREALLQMERFPGWEKSHAGEYDDWIAFEKETWSALDVITCGSTYVAQGLIEGGVSQDRIRVISYPIDEKRFQFVDRSAAARPKKLHVGFIGQIGLRKGAPYFLEVAKRFKNRDVQFTMIGSSHVNPPIAAELRQHVDMRQVPRSDVPGCLAAFDLIYFPTTCEGSSLSVLEAMATGLPVVTSPNSGTIARNGQEGFIGPYDDLDFAQQSINRLLTDRDLRLAMGQAAAQRYAESNLSHYSAQIKQLVNSIVNPALETSSFAQS